jgi:hypothetical protein
LELTPEAIGQAHCGEEPVPDDANETVDAGGSGGGGTEMVDHTENRGVSEPKAKPVQTCVATSGSSSSSQGSLAAALALVSSLAARRRKRGAQR